MTHEDSNSVGITLFSFFLSAFCILLEIRSLEILSFSLSFCLILLQIDSFFLFHSVRDSFLPFHSVRDSFFLFDSVRDSIVGDFFVLSFSFC